MIEPQYKVGDRVLVEAIIAEVATVPTNWPVRVVLDRGDSQTIDCCGNVHVCALRPLSHD